MHRIFGGLAVLVLLGCGGDSGSPPATTVELRESLTVAADEYRFLPATLSSQETTVVRVDNIGALAHTWTVMAQPIAAELELTKGLVLAAAEVEPGQSSTVDLEALAPGRYQIVCAIPGHFSAGMIGELIIEAK